MRLSEIRAGDKFNLLRFRCPNCQASVRLGYSCRCTTSAEHVLDLQYKLHQKKFLRRYMVASMVMLLLYAHCRTWGKYSLSAPLLKIEKAMNLLDTPGFLRLAEACLASGDETCAKNSYYSIYRTNLDVEGLYRLAHFEAYKHEYKNAIDYFALYYQKGGANPAVSYEYAMALEKSGNIQSAEDFFRFSILQNKSELSIRAHNELLKLLISERKFQQASFAIEKFWARAAIAKAYFNTEYELAQKNLPPKPTRKIASQAKVPLHRDRKSQRSNSRRAS